MLRKQFKWRDKEANESSNSSIEDETWVAEILELDSEESTPATNESGGQESTPTADNSLKKSKRKEQKSDSTSAVVMKTLIHIAATSDEGYERDRAILSITGGNNIVDALKILIDPAFLAEHAAYTSEIYDITDSNRRNVAHYAVSMGNLGCVKYLASAAPRLFAQEDSAHRSPAYIAAALGQSECLRTIAESMPDSLGITDANGVSPAHAGALQGELECVRILTELAPHLFYETEASRKTPAHIAVFADLADVVEAIAKAVPDSFKITDADQLTPAHLAIMYGKKDCLKAILEFAPDSMQVPSGRGTTAEQMLASNTETVAQSKNGTGSSSELDVQEEGGAIEELDYEEERPTVQAQAEERVAVTVEGENEDKTEIADLVEEDEVAMLKGLLRKSLQLEAFMQDLRGLAELQDFEQDSLGVAFRLKGGSVLAMTNNGVIFSAIHSDNESSTTILVQALAGGVGRVVE